MSLINCPECDARISDKAEKCPQCGYPISASTTGSPVRDGYIPPPVKEGWARRFKDFGWMSVAIIAMILLLWTLINTCKWAPV